MQNLAGLSSAWTLWESIMVPSLLSGAGTWIGNIENTIEVCNSVQNLFWRSILNVPKSCPKIALICETKMLDMKHRIWKEKINILMRIKNLPNESLAKMIHEESMKNNWPGLGRDISQICNILKINDLNYNYLDINEIKKAIYHHHYNEMIEKIKRCKKLSDIQNDNFKYLQKYFYDKEINKVRLKFKIRTQMVDNIPGNFKNKYKLSRSSNCLRCNVQLSQDHIKVCPGRTHLRRGLDLSKLDDLAIYFARYVDSVSPDGDDTSVITG